MDQGIFITGGSGNTGQALLNLIFRDESLKAAEITCLCRPGGRSEKLRSYPVKLAWGDSSNAESLGLAYGGEETVIHIASIFHAGAVLEGCRAMRRLIAVSSTGVFSRHRSLAGKIADAEGKIESSGVRYTILRPTMIYGSPGDRNISKLIRLINRSRVVPLPAMGRSIFQPVHVNDLASCILSSLKTPESIQKSYNVPGGSAHSLGEIVGIISGLLGKKVMITPVPYHLAFLAVKIAGALFPRSPVNVEQIQRLKEDKSFDYSEAARELGYNPVLFSEGVSQQIRAMGLRTASQP